MHRPRRFGKSRSLENFQNQIKRGFLVFLLATCSIFLLFQLYRFKTDNGLQEGDLILDVCSESEFAEGHHERARRVSFEDLYSMEKITTNKEQQISVFARDEETCKEACKIISSQGYMYVHNLGVYQP